jgi:arylsulfatase B
MKFRIDSLGAASSRPRCAALLSTIVLGMLLVTTASLADAASKPNVVIFLADDLGWADVGFHGGMQIETPALDRLAREGAQLERFSTTPI